ncbi:hypothetical protein CDL15_Pgr012908 [Punica granatum]|uniref:SKA complex subunit 1 homolog n=1 Tax=Punica granatum TaxID=22663 RepID=A0A218XEP5_PUNGR|nr:hypothetical protein CDL15_Pgr012908 [Punica granatum]
MEAKRAGASLDSLVSSFNARIAELQELVIARNMYPGSSVADLSAVDAALKAMELQVQAIKDRLREETEAIPKAKQHDVYIRGVLDFSLQAPAFKHDPAHGNLKTEDEPVPMPKEKKGRASPPLWYITSDELDTLSSYMRGRLTVDRVNAAINDMAAYAEANAQLIYAPKKKELRDIAMTESIKGKHFFLETDMKGPTLKLDNTGKAILTVLRHLGRITETRAGHHRVIILLKPH